MANIITSKTRRQHDRKPNVSCSRNAFVNQKKGVSKGNLNEYLFEKRVQELTREGYNEDAICGMMHGSKGAEKGEKGNIKNIMKRTGGTIKLDGNI